VIEILQNKEVVSGKIFNSQKFSWLHQNPLA